MRTPKGQSHHKKSFDEDKQLLLAFGNLFKRCEDGMVQ
ncbi:hypothetical protein Ahia01_000163400, partial [Argonauta hians]